MKSEEHLRQLAEHTRAGVAQATSTAVELAEEVATAMGPNGRKAGKITCIGVWLAGKVAPPSSGLMHVGQGTGLQVADLVVLSEAPVSLKPMPAFGPVRAT